MGEIQRSSFLSTLLLGVGILLGFVTSVWLLPNYLSEKENGVLTLLISYSLIYSQFALLGLHTPIIRFFPYFKNESNRNNAYLLVMSMFALGGCILFAVYYYSTKMFFKDIFDKSPLFEQFYFYLLPLTFFMTYFYVFDAYSTAILKPVRGFLYKDVLQRVLIILVIAALIFFTFDFSVFVLLYTMAVCTPTLLFILDFIRERQISFKVNIQLYRKHLPDIAKVSWYSLLLGVSWVGVTNIDAIMIEQMLSLEDVGIYGRTVYFGMLVGLPYRAIHKIASGHLSNAFKAGDMERVYDIYYKSSLNQLILACFLFGGIWLNIDNIFQMVPPSYQEGKYVIFFIALGYLFQMAGGVNTAIISYSPFYRWNTYFVVILVALVVITNIIFIPFLGISGAALASAISIFLYNFKMFVFLKIKYKFQPLNWRHFLVIVLLAIAFLSSLFLPVFDSFILDIAIRSSLFSIIFGGLIVITKVSGDANGMLLFLYKKYFVRQQ